MLEGNLGNVAEATVRNARTAYRLFSDWLGEGGMAAPVSRITRATIRAWVAHRRSLVRCRTVKKELSALSSAFAWAVDAEWMESNPCAKISVAPDSKAEKQRHEAFTPEEVQRLLTELPVEWASAVRCCLGTFGQRLSDVLALRWEQFDWLGRVVHLVTGKTRTHLTLPMSEGFYAWACAAHAAALHAGGEAARFVHPRLRRIHNPSPRFTALVRRLGIGATSTPSGGERRNWHSKTFHSLRATVATQMHAAGISQGMAMCLIGHDSAAAHELYLRPSLTELRAAAAKLPGWL